MVSLKGQISRLRGQPNLLYTLIALQQHSPLPRRFRPTENGLSSRCLTSVIVRKLVFPSECFFSECISLFWYEVKLAPRALCRDLLCPA